MGLLDEARDFFVLHGHAGGSVDHENADVGAIDRVRCAARHRAFERIVYPPLLAHSGRVDEQERLAFPFIGDIDRIARRAGDFADNRARRVNQAR